MRNEVPGPVAVDEAGDADLLVGSDVSTAALIGEVEGLALGVGGEEFVEVRVVAEVQALDVLTVGVRARCLTVLMRGGWLSRLVSSIRVTLAAVSASSVRCLLVSAILRRMR